MTKREIVMKGLRQHLMSHETEEYDEQCFHCPYFYPDAKVSECKAELLADALEVLKAAKPVGNPEQLISALYDMRDEWIAKLPRGEWYKNDRGQGIEEGIEMAIKRLGEVLYGKAD